MTSKITSSKESTFHGVVHNKFRGSLTLSESGILFRCSDSGGLSFKAPLPWKQIVKHQVSPASHPKHLLKIIAASANDNADNDNAAAAASGKNASYTFQFLTRNGLESARREVSSRLAKIRGAVKRPRHDDDNSNNDTIKSANTNNDIKSSNSSPPSSTYITHDPIALAATRSSLLASDPSLRAQHRLLVLQNSTLTEEDFWETHHRSVADEYARISGIKIGGRGSGMKSSLDLGFTTAGGGGKSNSEKKDKEIANRGVVHLGVEEIRQIFLMYPAVHRAYEEKVPLELSEEQFWRKYLESEYFHRDRGRAGVHLNAMNEAERAEMERFVGKKRKTNEDDDERKGKKKEEVDKVDVSGDDARLAAAAGTDDIFSRYDPSSSRNASNINTTVTVYHHSNNTHIGTNLAVGQFDLASTVETERGDRYLGSSDLHPFSSDGGQQQQQQQQNKASRGSRVIDKYNRHWAIVLHPQDSVGTSDNNNPSMAALINREDVATKTIHDSVDREMSDLVGFANADENHADHSRGLGEEDGDTVELTLHNLGGYNGQFSSADKEGAVVTSAAASNDNSDLALKYTKYLAATLQATTEPLLRDENTGKVRGFTEAPTLKKAFPEPKIGRGLLEALSKKMAADSQTEADVQKLADTLPESFRTNLASYFRRSSELLRHFFALRSVFSEDSNDNGGIDVSDSQRNRLTSIVKGMEKVHGEMYELTRTLDLVESKMFKPIMDQLDWAFKLHREDSVKGGGGGFVPVAKGGFVPVA